MAVAATGVMISATGAAVSAMLSNEISSAVSIELDSVVEMLFGVSVAVSSTLSKSSKFKLKLSSKVNS